MIIWAILKVTLWFSKLYSWAWNLLKHMTRAVLSRALGLLGSAPWSITLSGEGSTQQQLHQLEVPRYSRQVQRTVTGRFRRKVHVNFWVFQKLFCYFLVSQIYLLFFYFTLSYRGDINQSNSISSYSALKFMLKLLS